MKLTITGVEEVERILEEIAPRHARNLMRATVHGMAKQVRDEARKNAPVGRSKKLRKNIKHKRKKSPPDKPTSEVYVDSPAYYWRFVERGTVNLPPRPFILPAKEKVDADKERILREEFGKKLEAALAREAKKR